MEEYLYFKLSQLWLRGHSSEVLISRHFQPVPVPVCLSRTELPLWLLQSPQA